MKVKKKLIEVALSLESINEEGSRRKRKSPGGYPTTFHKWWAQRPVAAARAILFAQMVDDPSSNPDLFPTEKDQQKERHRLFRIIEDLVRWENTTNEHVLQKARSEIWQSWRRACAENAGHLKARELFDRGKLPFFYDPFAGSGALPLEAQRLGMVAHASDLNPVAVIINKGLIEIPAKFNDRDPINPQMRRDPSAAGSWKGASGMAMDVIHYGRVVRDEAHRRLAALYPKVAITREMTIARPDLSPFVGTELTVVAWLWARTVPSPNPALSGVSVPLVSTFMLSTKAGSEVYVEPEVTGSSYEFRVHIGKPRDQKRVSEGTKLGANSFRCLLSKTEVPVTYEYINEEANAGRIGTRLMAIVANAGRRRVYLSPTLDAEALAASAVPTWIPDSPSRGTWGSNAQGRAYGFRTFADYFTKRQLLALETFSQLISDVRSRVIADATAAGLGKGSQGATAYADAVCTYLAIALSRTVDYGSSLATWRPKDNAMRSSLPNKAIQMTWDFAEGSPFGGSSSDFSECIDVVSKVLKLAVCPGLQGVAFQDDAAAVAVTDTTRYVVSTDPPYYDNVAYADLSDFLYVWLRRCLKDIYPDLFNTLATPKTEELVATPHRHTTKEAAERHFTSGIQQAMRRLAARSHPSYPMTVYYAFKQSESQTDGGAVSTGWETFLEGLICAGLSIRGTWPVRTEGDNRQTGIGANALASSIVLVCRARADDAKTASRREFVNALSQELPVALSHLQKTNIAPVDLAQAAIGPGMAVYSNFAEVQDSAGRRLSVREALTLINEVLDETLTQQEGDFDADSRWALAWFEEHGFGEGEYGRAEQLSKSKNTSVAGMVEAGILEAKRGKARLLKPDELPEDWDPSTDSRLTAWESVHHLIRALNSGEQVAASLATKLGGRAETARELAYRLYVLCERKKRATEALAYNGLVQSWPEISRIAKEGKSTKEGVPQTELFEEE